HLRHVPVSAVMAELGRRTAQTGLQEKAGRPDSSAG
ncbi:MAG: phosphoribosyl-ATP pyrophosphatase, partial [Aurantimonas sp.]|nr:phosphoribosyl-ATP pyrophosphatase [Aurantimonas sp.]